ncbi:MAG: peptidoglycan DD-metalloendopeptidase family protein [Sterolibacteriaceae bacterium]|uniref:Peptidoglycan DD-metalloendopeptidase family protein n=1 Tax=Candidatus Methylophosphatis roskildensis TaxID=2899263 RepID=A0A9D7HSA0_9PROT|nr:peptidoglycan DD-metalloendopeptidase family protein [Candidatus Methylophosphatis roskildensis]
MLGIALGLSSQPLLAQKEPPRAAITEKRSDLKEVQERIRDLQKEISRSEESRDDAAEALRETEQTISTNQRRLRELADTRREAEAELARIAAASAALDARVKSQQAELEKLLTRFYVSGQAQGLRHMLSGSDPNQLARDLYYLKQLSRSEADMIDSLRSSLAEQESLLDKARAARDALAEIQAEQQAELAQLAVQKRKRKSVLAELSDKLRSQRKEVGTLKRNETRLSQLIEGLTELARKQAAAAEKARRQAQAAEDKRRAREAAGAARAAREPAEHAGSEQPRTAEPAPRHEAPIARIDETPEDSPGATPFAQLRGRMRLPVRGELMNRFGTPRVDGGSSWRGVFIRATAGGEVKAIAAGRIAFADWLRGFGNLVIIDHGDDYLSIYGYNESVLRGAGQMVRAGEAIASVGNSGGSEESGLYFELRHRGQPIDPLRWLSLR